MYRSSLSVHFHALSKQFFYMHEQIIQAKETLEKSKVLTSLQGGFFLEI